MKQRVALPVEVAIGQIICGSDTDTIVFLFVNHHIYKFCILLLTLTDQFTRYIGYVGQIHQVNNLLPICPYRIRVVNHSHSEWLTYIIVCVVLWWVYQMCLSTSQVYTANKGLLLRNRHWIRAKWSQIVCKKEDPQSLLCMSGCI